MRLSPLAQRRLLLSAATGFVVLLVAVLAAPRLVSFARGPSSAETTLEKLDV
ncbi:MAG: hypothetical protein HYU41_01390, partial [Candidatus Rokubacteria bacterium]|nr:hypothetical protein [Candidatus Rokubacteria bacterium]